MSVMVIVYHCTTPPRSNAAFIHSVLDIITCHPDFDERAVPENALHAAVSGSCEHGY